MPDCCIVLNARLKRKAKCLLLAMTLLQMMYFFGYLTVYLLHQTDFKSPEEAAAFHKYQIYRLDIIVVLFGGMVYFLFISLFKKQKNPNELID